MRVKGLRKIINKLNKHVTLTIILSKQLTLSNK